jgi:signal transduction histidine kinase
VRRRIVWATISVAIAGILVLGVPLALLARKAVRDDAQRRLDREAASVGFAIDDDLEHHRVLDRALLDRLAGDDRRIRVFLTGGTVVTGGAELEGRTITGSASVERHGRVSVTIAAHDTERSEVVAVAVVALLAVAGVVAAILLALVVARRLGEPVRELALASERLGAGDFSARSSRSGIAELDAVAAALEHSAARIDDLVRSEREMAANASHQLRTPLTALRLHLEELVATTDGTAREEAVAALTQADRLAATIDEMLASARAHARADLRRVDVGRLVTERVEQWRAAARREHRSIDLRAAPGCDAEVIAPAVAQAVDALIDNALRHGAGIVRVGVARRARHVEVTVEDEGPGVPVDVGDTVFERHVSFRGGTGVGLALARSLVEASGGRLDLVDADHARFRILLANGPAPGGANADGAPV